MELTSTRTLDAPLDTIWAVLNDPAVLKACIPGCDVFEPGDEGGYRVSLQAKVGPVSARFSARVTLEDVQPSTAYTLRFEGQGGAAGFARGESRVTLTALTPATTELAYTVKAQVGGKLAQIGSRLIDGAAAKMADDFFTRFIAHVAPPPADDAPAQAPDPAPADAAPEAPVQTRGNAGIWARYLAIAAVVILLWWMYMHRG
jgi:carbon monoxide dehydrogenase subunit G